jgi:hypothetical protein
MVVVGSSWRMSFDNTSCRTFYREPASNGNSSTIAMACKQCQTNYPIEVHVIEMEKGEEHSFFGLFLRHIMP